MRCHFTPTSVAVIKKQKITNADVDVENENPTYCW